jgi:hypothetical protein
MNPMLAAAAAAHAPCAHVYCSRHAGGRRAYPAQQQATTARATGPTLPELFRAVLSSTHAAYVLRILIHRVGGHVRVSLLQRHLIV